MIKQPKLGDMIFWFEGGAREHGACPAIVTAVGNGGMLRCNVFSVKSNVMRVTNWIRQIDDPYYVNHPIVAEKDGAWDWTEKKSSALDEAFAQLQSGIDAIGAVIPSMPSAEDVAPVWPESKPKATKKVKV